MSPLLRHAFLALAATLTCTSVMAATPADVAPTIEVHHAWIRILPAGLPAGGYAVIQNTGNKARTLTSVTSAAYAGVMLHRTTEKAGVSHMDMVNTLTIPARGVLTLAPGHYHLMFMHATRMIHPGDKVVVTLHFAQGSDVKADFLAMPANSTGPQDNK